MTTQKNCFKKLILYSKKLNNNTQMHIKKQ